MGALNLGSAKWASIGKAVGAQNLGSANWASIGGQIAICPPIPICWVTQGSINNCAATAMAMTSGCLPSMPGMPMGQVIRASS